MATVEQRKQEVDFSHLELRKLSAQDEDDFRHGVVLFNSGQFWESHEAWEQVWQRHPESGRIFFQGLIQVAAGLHQLERNIFHGTEKHLRNALWKLEPFQPECLGVDVAVLVRVVKQLHKSVRQAGAGKIAGIDRTNFPQIMFQE